MTIFIADIASYQQGLSLAALRQAGFTGVNFKISHGLGQKSVHPSLHSMVSEARAAGMGISTFHWLQGRSVGTGQQQAAYAYARMQELPGGTSGLAHVVDVEEDGVTESIWSEYCATMATLLGRDIVTYTGDWWWTDRAAGWKPSPFSPWLWAAPNVGYLGAYPGDGSSHWTAGYGGWSSLAAMQYAVEPVAGIDASLSAVKVPQIWASMRGESMGWILVASLVSLRNEFNALSPSRDKATDGSIGDAAHAAEPSDHNPDETGQGEREDSDNIDEVHAIDVDKDLRKSGWSMTRAVNIIVDRHKRGLDNRLEYVIWDRTIWSRNDGWTARDYEGSNPHTDHAHFSARYGSGSGTGNPENSTAPWGLLAADQEEDPMAAFTKADLVDAAHDGSLNVWWDAVHAQRQADYEAGRRATPDATYAGADSVRKGEMRNARDVIKEMVQAAIREMPDETPPAAAPKK